MLSLIVAANVFATEAKFVSPLPGAQLIGPVILEVTTDATGVNRVDFFVDGALAGVARTAPYRITYDFGTSLGAHELTAKVYADGYREVAVANTMGASIAASEQLDVDMVEVPLRARSARPLRASDLRVRENGRVQTIRDVLPQRGAAHFAFVVDRSLSMNDGRLTAALAAIDAARKQLRPDDTASIVTFNHNVAAAQALPKDSSAATRLRDLVPSGGTSLRDAVASIASDDRTYAIVLTDGGDRNSQLGEEEALRRVSGTKTVVEALVLGSPSPFLQKAAANTGGDVVRTSAATLARDLARVIADINSRYLVVYQSSGGARGWRKLLVDSRARGVDVLTARKGYFAR